jgi:putative long chain acyl-CoA synthase
LGLVAVDLVVVYVIDVDGDQVAVAAVTRRRSRRLTTVDIDAALNVLPRQQRPQLVLLVDRIDVTSSYRPKPEKLRRAGLLAGQRETWYFDPVTDSYCTLTNEDESTRVATCRSHAPSSVR